MSKDWLQRLRPLLKLKSPSGETFEAKWIGDTRTKQGKVALFNFPGIRGTVAYDQLPESDSYPLTFHFDGPDNDKTSARFWAACNQRGKWNVVHPVEGFLVLQFLSVTDAIQPVTSGNVRVFTVDAIEPIDPQTLTTTTELRSEIAAQLDVYNERTVAQFATVDTSTFTALDAINGTVGKITTKINTRLSKLVAQNNEIARIFDATQRGIQDTLDAVIFKPIQLAGQMQQLMQAPALAVTDVGARLAAYKNLMLEILGIEVVENMDGYNVALVKELALTSLLGAMGTVAGDASTLKNRTEALEFSIVLADALKTVTNNLDEDQSKFETRPIEQQYFSQSECYTESLKIITLGIQNFLIAAFDLAIEKRYTLDNYKTPAHIAFENYGAQDLDSNTDFVIETNKLVGNDIIILPPGREVVVYV
ncbi:MAG: hypothetical protein ACWGMZ_04060 [Thermoguttaceae bacterium]